MRQLILTMALILTCMTGYAQGGYDPESPGDPNPYRKLLVLASPKAGGTVSSNVNTQVGVGQSVTCYASSNTYYNFVRWLLNGEVVSTESRYTFEMPDEDVEMVAEFEYDYNPISPGDPQEVKPSHRVTLTASPGKGGSFNNSVFKLCEGDSINIYAYPNVGYRFEEWLLDGVLVSTKNPLKIKMTDKDLNFTARFSYNPANPEDPSANMFNPATGEMVIDRFVTGSLSSAIYNLLGDNYSYSDVSSIVVSGTMDGSDFGIFRRLSNCTKIDLSRTNGYNEIPSYAFRSLTSLTEVVLSSCINSIGSYAFTDCNSLSVVTCYTLIPPTLYNKVFNGVDESLVIKVPSQSINLYQNAQGWIGYTILSADGSVYSMTVSLPENAKDGRYKNMYLELVNTDNGQRYKYLITDKTDYVFGNLLPSTTYSVYVKNSKGEVLGELTGLEVVDKDITATFESLRQPVTVAVVVSTSDGVDITSDVTVKWFDENKNILQQGASLTGILENSKVSYSVTLPKELQTVYQQPAIQELIVIAGQSTLTCMLEKLKNVTLTGKITDSNGKAISSVIITISQNINGVYGNSINAQCDNEGNYSIEVPNVPLKVTVLANGYVSQNKELAQASAGIGDVQLAKITGITIIPSYTIQTSVADGEESQVSDWYSDDANVAYRVENQSGDEVVDCITQAGNIVLPESIAVGDQITVVAYSKNNKFKEGRQTVVIDSKTTQVIVPLIEYGGVSVTSESDANTDICILYNSEGKQVGKSSFRNNVVTFENLPDGQYSIVAMSKSELLGSVTNLSSFQQTQLVKGIDYLLYTVSVTSGNISSVSIGNIPELDEAKLYYTDNKETYFMSNKSQLTIGNYVTLKSKITIKDEYASLVDAATLVVDIPSNCEFVANSVISGSGYLGYELGENRISIPIQRLSDAVRFCIIPLDGGVCKPTAFVKLVVDNKEIMQPIGSAYFEAKNFSLSAPIKTSKTKIGIRGTATADSEVKIYDNGNLVGITNSMPNGEWSAILSLHKPYTKSLHNIYGEVITKAGKRLLTQNRTVDYDQSYVELSKVTMIYNNNNIVFDHLNGKISSNSYTYVPSVTDFTFVADFTENNPQKISNVVIKVLASDGSMKSLPAEYSSVSKKWVVRTKYADSKKIPVNVTAEYDLAVESDSYCEEAFNDQMTGLVQAADYLQGEFEDNVTIDTSVDEEDRFEGYLNYGDHHFPYNIEIIDYDNVYNVTMYEKQFYLFKSGEDTFYFNVESNDAEMVYTVVDPIEKTAFSIIIGNDETQSPSRAASWAWVNTMKKSFSDGTFLRKFSGAMGNLLDIFGLLEYINVRGDFNLMLDNAVRYADSFLKMDKHTFDMMLAKCQNGDYKLESDQMKLAQMEKNELSDRTSMFSDKYYKYLTDYKWALGWNVAGFIASFGVGKLIGVASKLIKKGGAVFKWYNKYVSGSTNVETAGDVITNSLGIAYNGIQTGASEVLHPAFYDFNGVKDKLRTWAYEESQDISKQYMELNEKIERAYKVCPKDEEDINAGGDGGANVDDEEVDDDNFPTPPITPSIDPSGYVYEAVPSNRIEGVTATAYYKQQDEDMYGEITETAVVWDAVPFGQENPLVTDALGMYAWDVPAGMWQVRFEKEGYEPTQSEWLPVPPPQLDVNVGMVQAKQPAVKSVHAYSDGVTVEFDKFMLPATLTIGNVSVTQNGQLVGGKIIASDIEEDANGNSFCSKIEYKPNEPLAEGDAVLFVSKAIKSYANINMSEDFMQSFTIEPRITEISVSKKIEVNSGSKVTVDASILPGAAAIGKTVFVESLNTMIANVSVGQVEADANGQLSFDVSGLIIGSTAVKLTIERSDISAIINVTVGNHLDAVAKPSASVESGEVLIGTEVTLACETENVSIFYTTDGSCPCESGAKKYDGTALAITENTTLKIMAVSESGDESEVVTYTYTLRQTNQQIPLAKGWNWVSHNQYNNLTSDQLQINNVDRVKTQDGEISRGSNSGFTGHIDDVNATEAFKVYTNAAGNLSLGGVMYNPYLAPVSLTSGWNWIGYPLEMPMSVDNAFSLMESEVGDCVVNLDGGYALYDGDNWIGTLETLTPGQGYLFKSASDKELTYNLITASSTESNVSTQNEHPWTVDKHAYPDVMCVTADLYDKDVRTTAGEYLVGAFVDGECRGVGCYVDNTIFLSVYGDKNVEVQLKAMNMQSSEVLDITEKITFKADVVGTLSAPYSLHLQVPVGISNVKADELRAKSIHNVLGQKVKSIDRGGVFIIDGKKRVVTKRNEHEYVK